MPKEMNSNATLKEAPSGSYITDDLPKSELIKRLKKLHELLSSAAQSQEVAKTYKGIAKSISETWIISHRDKDIKLLTACCLADIIRIFAPEPPFEQEQLRNVFSLFIEQIRGVSSKGEANFTLHFFLLERLSTVKAFILLLEIGDDEMIDELFSVVYSMVSPGDLQGNVSGLLVDVLVAVIDESERLPKQSLDSVLLPLTSEKRKESPASYSFSKSIVQSSWEHLRQEVSILYKDAGDSDISGKIHELIFELNRTEPRILKDILPQLEGELRVDTDEIRLSAVKLLSRMFAAQGSKLHIEYTQLFQTFLSRFNDKLPSIRVVMLDFARHFLITHREDKATLDKELLWRLRDQNEEVRAEAVAVVCDVCKEIPDVVEQSTLYEAMERMKDKKGSIRGDAMQRFASLYVSLSARFGDNQKDSEEEEEEELPSWWERFSALPNKIICCYMLGFEEDKIRVLNALSTMVEANAINANSPTKKTPKKSSDQQIKSRADNLLRIVKRLDEKADAAFLQLIKDQRVFQREFLKLHQLKKDPIGKNNAENTQKMIGAISEWLSVRVPAASNEKSKEFMRKIFDEKESSRGNLKNLLVIADSSTTISDAEQSFQALRRSIADAKTEYISNVAKKLNSYWFANAFIVSKLLELVNKSRDGADRLLAFLISLANLYPNLVSSSLGEVMNLLDVKHLKTIVSDSVLFILASDASNGLEKKDSQLVKKTKKRILTFCEVGTPLQAKLAVRSLSKMLTNSERELTTLLRSLSDKINLENEELPTILQSIAAIAQVIDNGNTIETTSLSAIQFVTDTLLKQQQKKREKGHLDLTLAKVCGVKMLTRYLCSIKEHHTLKAAPIISQFFEIISPSISENKEEGEKEESKTKRVEPEVERVIVCSIIRLAKFKAFDQLIGPEQLQILSSIALSENFETRSAFERKLAKELISIHLPLKYIALLCFYSCENKKELFIQARTHVQQSIQARREYLKRIGGGIIQNQQIYFSLLPEYALPYLVSLVAHSKGFANEDYKFAMRSLFLLLSMLLHGGGDDYTFLNQLVEFMRTTDDARTPQLTQNVHIACELARRIVRKAAETKAWKEKGTHPGDIFLPPQFFKPLEGDKLKALAEKDVPIELPEAQLIEIPNDVQKGPLTPSKKQKSSTNSTSTSTSSTSSTTTTTITTPRKKRTNTTTVGKSPKRQLIVDDDDDESDDEDEEISGEKGGQVETPSRVMPRRGAKRRISYNEPKEIQEDDEEEPTKKSIKKKEQPEKKKVSKKEEDEDEKMQEEEIGEEKPQEKETKKRGKGKKAKKDDEDEEEEDDEKPKKKSTKMPKEDEGVEEEKDEKPKKKSKSKKQKK